ncbi:MAG TPA: glycine cleavage system aminomethyltransferase GcvT [Thermoanaerobaculia bacterium]|nr:glycine cleavage system aminomethyltransferase GcvT [Thermoanaerobaculia bacterium]
MSEETLRRTPLYDLHREAGGKMVPFAGWEMPVQYTGVIDEHTAVRQRAGLFDVSHMGEVRVDGAGATAFLDALTPNHVAKLAIGRAHYSGLLNEGGTYIDDLLIYRLGDESYLVVVNASNVARDFAWIAERAPTGVTVENVSDAYALLALQGPRAVDILTPLTGTDLSAIRYYGFAMGEVAGVQTLISRTGYTGEDGFELYVPPDGAPAVWRKLFEVGAAHGLLPAGLGARDTLRLEAGMALYGHELNETTTPFEAGLAWVVKLDKGHFVGRDALVAQQARGLTRQLAGFEIEGRGIAREGHAVQVEGATVGAVTSGTWSPTLEKALGLAYVPVGQAAVGTSVAIEVRGKVLPARIAKTPFYQRSK